VSQGKIEPLISAAEQRATAKSQADLREFLAAIDTQLYVLEKELDEKIEQIQARLRKLEEGSGTPAK
jgi:cob(I)alamin adenosyltransferase